MQVLLTGATGLIGPRLVKELAGRGHRLSVTSRSPEKVQAKLGPDITAYGWQPAVEPFPAQALEGTEALVNLLGEKVDQRWTDRAKRKIYESRVCGTRKIVDAMAKSDSIQKVLVNASAVGYYGPRGSEAIDENAEPGDDFLAKVTRDWESEALKAGDLEVRVVLIRTGVVLSPSGGALARMRTPFMLGLGGPVGGGRQYMPWIHIDDLVSIFAEAVENESYRGPVNATSPNPVTNREFSKKLGSQLSRPSLLPLPAPILRVALGEMAQIVTTGARVIPTRALEAGFNFDWPDLEPALSDLFS